MGVKLRFAVGVAAIWLVAVAGVSFTAWVAINRAGRDVNSASVGALPQASIGTTADSTTPGQGRPSTDPTTQPSASNSPKPSASETPTSSPSPSPQGNPPNSPLSSATPQDRTVTVTGGQVSVRCTGAVITLRIAQPDNGWRVELDASETAHVQVTFKRGETESAGETQVTALCSAGTPVFTVDNRN